MATASISLIREQSEAVGPPRALWVPFPLGRPLGVADDPEFQTAVLRAALDLLVTATEPTIEDFPIEAPAGAPDDGPWACPVNLAPEPGGSFADRLSAEIARLRPWSIETRRRRGRTLFGASGAGPDHVDDVAAALASVADTGDVGSVPEADGIDWAFAMPLLLRHLTDDLRTFYHEAIASQPGSGSPDHDDLNDWIFGATVLGEVLTAIADHLTSDGSPMALLVRGLVIPEGRYRGGSAF